MARYRSIWISDIHLGTKGCQAEKLLDFLRCTESEYLYLVGDIIDFWSLRRSWFWPETHNTVVQKILRKSRSGTRVFYIQGNHDPMADWMVSILNSGHVAFGPISLSREATHVAADGKIFMVLHGDQFDSCMQYAPWLAKLGDRGYSILLGVNRLLLPLTRFLGIHGRWSLAGYVKRSMKTAVSFISDFEEIVARSVRKNEAHGIICGHIHHASIRQIDGISYMNDGDWIESCSALCEHEDGRFEIIRWDDLLPDGEMPEVVRQGCEKGVLEEEPTGV
ncbi:MAG: UDP-2,3-diacylglucosamine diphosphatase [Leptospirillum sp.]